MWVILIGRIMQHQEKSHGEGGHWRHCRTSCSLPVWRFKDLFNVLPDPPLPDSRTGNSNILVHSCMPPAHSMLLTLSSTTSLQKQATSWDLLLLLMGREVEVRFSIDGHSMWWPNPGGHIQIFCAILAATGPSWQRHPYENILRQEPETLENWIRRRKPNTTGLLNLGDADDGVYPR